MEMVTVELCRSNSIRSRFIEPTVIEVQQVSRSEAEALLRKEMVNGYYWRVQPEDRTGN